MRKAIGSFLRKSGDGNSPKSRNHSPEPASKNSSFRSSIRSNLSVSHERIPGETKGTGTYDREYAVNLDDYCEPPRKLKSNLTFDDFEDCALYAEGTNAVIYRALYNSVDVVIKMVKKEAAHNEIVADEFDMELSILKHCDHPNVIRYHGSGTVPRQFIVMEFLDEGTLGELFVRSDRSKRIDSKSPPLITFRDALHYGHGLAEALHYLHTTCVPGVSIIHRDLKPDNIGISDGVVKLFDFGLSICVQRTSSSSETYEMTGCTGTMRYMSPEVALGNAYSEKVDVYSFGVILWQMATDNIPYKKVTKAEFMESVVRGGSRPPVNPEWPSDFIELLETCWTSKAEARPSFDIVARVLEDLLEDYDNGRLEAPAPRMSSTRK